MAHDGEEDAIAAGRKAMNQANQEFFGDRLFHIFSTVTEENDSKAK